MFLQRGDVDAAVLVIRRDVHHALDVFLLEHLAVVLVGPHAPSRPIVLLVIDLRDLPRDVAAGADPGVPLAPRWLLEEAPDARAVAERLPIDVVLAVPVGIDER